MLGDDEEEKLIEIKTNKVELCKKLQYFNRKLSEIYHEKEIFIHDTFDCDLFQDFINSILTNHIKINAKNCFEYLNLSNKYEYTEMQHQITQFIQQRPDLRLIITQISNTERNVNNNNWDDDEEEEFRKIINSVVENGNEILYLFQENKYKEAARQEIEEFINQLENTTKSLLQVSNHQEKDPIIKSFYKEIELTRYQEMIKNEFYPIVERIPNEFPTTKELDIDSLFQDFDPTKNGGNIDFDSFKMIEPPEEFDNIIKNEEERNKYDKYVSIVNMIISIINLEKFKSIYEKNESEYNQQEEHLTKDALSKLDPTKVDQARRTVRKIKRCADDAKLIYKNKVQTLLNNIRKLHHLKGEDDSAISSLQKKTNLLEAENAKYKEKIIQCRKIIQFNEAYKQKINKLNDDHQEMAMRIQRLEGENRLLSDKNCNLNKVLNQTNGMVNNLKSENYKLIVENQSLRDEIQQNKSKFHLFKK